LQRHKQCAVNINVSLPGTESSQSRKYKWCPVTILYHSPIFFDAIELLQQSLPGYPKGMLSSCFPVNIYLLIFSSRVLRSSGIWL